MLKYFQVSGRPGPYQSYILLGHVYGPYDVVTSYFKNLYSDMRYDELPVTTIDQGSTVCCIRQLSNNKVVEFIKGSTETLKLLHNNLPGQIEIKSGEKFDIIPIEIIELTWEDLVTKVSIDTQINDIKDRIDKLNWRIFNLSQQYKKFPWTPANMFFGKNS